MTDREKLLIDTLGDGDGAGFARGAAAHARRRRALRQAALTGVAGALLIAFFSLRAPPPGDTAIAPTAAPVATAAFEVITDQELLAQLKDRPALFLKDQGRITGVVFLPDQPGDARL